MKRPDSIFIEGDFKLTDSLMTNIGKTKLIIVRQQEIIKLTKNKGITLYRLFPLELKNSEFYISVVPFDVTRKRKHLFYANGGGYSIVFAYKDGQFKFLRVENNGI
jgi:hypothetical protein